MNHRPPVGQAARAGNAQSLEFVMRHGHHQSVVQARIGQGGRQGDSVLARRLSAEGWETERQEREYMSLSKVASISNLDTVVLAQSCASHLTQCLWSSVRRWAMALALVQSGPLRMAPEPNGRRRFQASRRFARPTECALVRADVSARLSPVLKCWLHSRRFPSSSPARCRWFTHAESPRLQPLPGTLSQ